MAVGSGGGDSCSGIQVSKGDVARVDGRRGDGRNTEKSGEAGKECVKRHSRLAMREVRREVVGQRSATKIG